MPGHCRACGNAAGTCRINCVNHQLNRGSKCKHKFWKTSNGKRHCEDCGLFIGMNPDWVPPPKKPKRNEFLAGFLGAPTPVVITRMRCQVCGEEHEIMIGGKPPGESADYNQKLILKFEKKHKKCWSGK